jgi:hypothetical protein
MLQPEGSSNSLIFWNQLEGGYNPLSLPHPTTLKYKCRPTVTTTITATVTTTFTVITITSHPNLSTCHYIQPVTSILSLYPTKSYQPVQLVTVTDTQPNPLTWIIYQGHLSTRCPTSPTHASTKHVPISPTYHHKICVSTKYQPIPCTMHQPMYHNLYQVHQPCINTCSTINHVFQVPIMYHTMYQPCTPTMYINHVSYHVHQPYTIYHEMCLNHIPYHAIHHIPINQDMKQQCISPSRPQPTCTMHPMMFLKS